MIRKLKCKAKGCGKIYNGYNAWLGKHLFKTGHRKYKYVEVEEDGTRN